MRVVALLAFSATLIAQPGICAEARVLGYRIVARYPHSTTSYTEGFFYHDGLMYEGTGLKGQSHIFAEDLSDGRIRKDFQLPSENFGEGIVDVGPSLYEWTWQSHTGFILDRTTFRVTGHFHYDGEGWGMTRSASEIITSDGTATLRFRNPQSFVETRHIEVHDGTRTIDQLNELEYVRGVIYANVWHSDRIARIDQRDGRVLSWIDCSGLLSDVERPGPEAVLNGIGYDAAHDRLFVTGKQWPWIFEIKVVARPK